MKDPDVVAFEFPRPWPERSHWQPQPNDVRWQMRYRHTCDDPSVCGGCRGRSNSEMFPWWRLSSYSKFSTLAGVRVYWPSAITIWHHDPSDYDFGTTCKRDSHWHWHFHHMHVQIHAIGHARRYILTRCEWCGGRSRKGDQVNCSDSWNRKPGHWWQGERGLFHSDCSSVARAHRTCLCDVPQVDQRGYGECATCGKFAAWGTKPEQLEPTRILAAIPAGGRMTPEIKARVSVLWERLRADGAS